MHPLTIPVAPYRPIITDPEHLRRVEGHRFVVLRATGALAQAFDQIQREARRALAELRVSYPNVPHVSLCSRTPGRAAHRAPVRLDGLGDKASRNVAPLASGRDPGSGGPNVAPWCWRGPGLAGAPLKARNLPAVLDCRLADRHTTSCRCLANPPLASG